MWRNDGGGAKSALRSAVRRKPRIYHAFQRGWYACTLMEYIEGWTLHDWLKENPAERDWAVEKIARNITQMSRFPVPDGASPGPVGGGYLFPRKDAILLLRYHPLLLHRHHGLPNVRD